MQSRTPDFSGILEIKGNQALMDLGTVYDTAAVVDEIRTKHLASTLPLSRKNSWQIQPKIAIAVLISEEKYYRLTDSPRWPALVLRAVHSTTHIYYVYPCCDTRSSKKYARGQS